ncbi:hypothetical protein BH20VER3_BH20VER3_13520 [soil metagenome]
MREQMSRANGGSRWREKVRHFRVKKLAAVLVIALLAAAVVWVIVRVQLTRRLARVPDLLPATTLALLEVPDFRQTRRQWHESDLYQIWREPTVQAWLEKPLGRLLKDRPGHQALQDFLQLGPTDGFLALTSLENNEAKLVVGFHFDRSPTEARQFIEQRETDFFARNANPTRETIIYEQHKIETVQIAHVVFARVYDNQWFFASNDLAVLKTLLDRLDHRREKAQTSLAESEAFVAATAHLGQDHAFMFYLDPRPFVEKLTPLIALTGQSLALDQLLRFRQMRSVATAIGFDQGKMRETDFVAMPSLGAEKKFERPLLGAAGTNSFLYSVSRLHWSDNLRTPSAPVALGLPALLRQITAAMKARGISLADWRQAFGDELEIVGDWAADSHWPAFVSALPIKDAARARQITEALTSVELAGAPWTHAVRNDVVFYSSRPFGDFVPIQPAFALTDTMMLAGSDLGTVESTLGRLAHPPDELQKSALFHEAAIKVPRADNAFNYVDTRLLYERVDAAARPLLLMGATFYPALAKTVDATKLPPAEAIAKHLSPIVMSQRYDKDGYVTESVGPVTFREATIGLVGAVGSLYFSLQKILKDHSLLQSLNPTPNPTPVPPSASPSPSPI